MSNMGLCGGVEVKLSPNLASNDNKTRHWRRGWTYYVTFENLRNQKKKGDMYKERLSIWVTVMILWRIRRLELIGVNAFTVVPKISQQIHNV